MDAYLTLKVKSLMQDEGADLVGIADVGRFTKMSLKVGPKPQEVYPEAKSVIVAAVRMTDACMEMSARNHYQNPGPGIINHQMSNRLNWIAMKTVHFLENSGYPSLGIFSTCFWRYRPYKQYPTPFTADVSHRHMAVGAGLGEFGWNGLLLTPEYGPRIRLITVITTASLEPSPMYEGPALCDKCMKCVEACKKHLKGLTKEVHGKVQIEIGGKKFEYANKNLWRCAWTENFGLDCAIELPDKIDEKVMTEISKEATLHHPEWWKTWTIEPCWRYCLPPHLRFNDPEYTDVPRRKKPIMVTDNSIMKNKIIAEIESCLVKGGVNEFGVISIEESGKELSIFKRYLPDASSVLIFSLKYPLHFKELRGYLSQRRDYLEMDVINYLDNLGYSAIQMSYLQNSPNRSTEDERAFALAMKTCRLTRDNDKETDVFGGVITSAQLQITMFAPRKQRKIAVKNISANKDTSQELRDKIKAIAYQNGIDLLGIAPAERLENITAQLRNLFEKEYYFEANDTGFYKGPTLPQIKRKMITVKKPSDYLGKARSVVVLGLHFSDAAVDWAAKSPSESVGPYCFSQTWDYFFLSESAFQISNFLESKGYLAVPVADLSGIASRVISSYVGSYPDISANRFAAIAAGLGELGWHGRVLTPKFGVRQKFFAIITDAELESDPLYQGPSLCKRCFKCVKTCPVQAISRRKVSLNVEGKIFEFGIFNRLRCDWAIRYGLVGDEGPGFVGSETDIKPPKNITKKALDKALKQMDPIQKNYLAIRENCLVNCPAVVPAISEFPGREGL